jgi:glutathione S-transferase
MSDIVVYGVPGSPFVRAVQMGLEEKGVTYRLQPMGPHELKSEAYLVRHPILRYLDDVFPTPAFVPADPRAAAKMNQIIGINDWYFFPKAAAPIVFQRVVGPVFFGLPTDEAAITDALPMARTCVAELDRLLGSQRYLACDEMSIADLMLAPQIDFLVATPDGRNLLEGTGLKAWLGRMNARASMIATQRPEPLRGAA